MGQHSSHSTHAYNTQDGCLQRGDEPENRLDVEILRIWDDVVMRPGYGASKAVVEERGLNPERSTLLLWSLLSLVVFEKERATSTLRNTKLPHSGRRGIESISGLLDLGYGRNARLVLVETGGWMRGTSQLCRRPDTDPVRREAGQKVQRPCPPLPAGSCVTPPSPSLHALVSTLTSVTSDIKTMSSFCLHT